MTTVAAEGRTEISGAISELGGRKPQVAGNGAANVTGKQDNSAPKTDGLIEAIVSRGNMMAAYTRVMRNKGAPGVDSMPVTALKEYLQEQWPRIKEELLAGKYTPLPVLKVEIPKPEGGTRMLGIPTVLDRLIQQAVHQVLSRLFDPEFSSHSHGFRPEKSAHQAIKAARQYVESGKRWVVDIDLEKFFDRVNHDILMSLVKRKVKDKQVLKLIDSYLKAGMMEGGVVSPRQEGTPQGGPLSPLLSNILLDELDKELENRGHSFCRYADDCNIYVRSERAGKRVMASVERFISTRLRLKVNQSKSAVAKPETRHFLGFRLLATDGKPEILLSERSEKRLRERILELTPRSAGRSLSSTISQINRYLQGWKGFFGKCTAGIGWVLQGIDAHIRRRLRAIVLKHWKRKLTIAKRLIQLGVNRKTAWRRVYESRKGIWALTAR